MFGRRRSRTHALDALAQHVGGVDLGGAAPGSAGRSVSQWLTRSSGLSGVPAPGGAGEVVGVSKPNGVSCSTSNAGRYHGAAPPSFSARTTTLRRCSIISPSVGSGSPGDHTSARRARPPRSSDPDRVGGVDVVLEHEHDDLVGVLPQEVVDAAEGVDGRRRSELAVHVAEVHLGARSVPGHAEERPARPRSRLAWLGLSVIERRHGPTRCAGRCARRSALRPP